MTTRPREAESRDGRRRGYHCHSKMVSAEPPALAMAFHAAGRVPD